MPVDLTTALGTLLSDAALRAEFRRDPAACAERLDLCREDRHAFQSLAPEELEVQGVALVHKRRREVARLAPETFARLGPAAEALFDEHATRRWPTGHKRHVEDALAFLEHLEASGDRRACRWERNRLRFALSSQRLAFHLLPLPRYGRVRLALQVLASAQGVFREQLFGLAWPGKTARVGSPASAPQKLASTEFVNE